MVQALLHSLRDVFEVQQQVRKPAVESLLFSVPEIQITMSTVSVTDIHKRKNLQVIFLWQEQITKTTENIIWRYLLKGLGQKMNIFEGL